MSKVFKVTCEYYVKAKDIEEVKVFVSEEAGQDFFEKHIIIEEEHDKLIKQFGITKTEDYIRRVNNYVGSTGKKYKSHYHTILNWAGKDEIKPVKELARSPKGSEVPGKVKNWSKEKKFEGSKT